MSRFGRLNPGARRFAPDPSEHRALLRESPYSSPFLVTRRTHVAGTEEALARVRTPVKGQAMQTPELATRDLTPSPFQNQPTVPTRDELKYASFQNLPLNISAASVRVLLKPASGSRRVYLFIANTTAAGIYYVAFGQDATALNGIPILPNFGFVEFNNVIPQDDIYIIATAPNVLGVLVYSNDTVIGVQQ